MKIDFTWKIGGEAGFGIMSSGLIFAKTCMRSGYFAFDCNEYPSLIRGGHNTYIVRAAEEEIHSQLSSVNILVALNKNAIDFHREEISKGGAVILNADKVNENEIKQSSKFKVFPVPLVKLALQVGGKDVMMNNVALGASFALLKGDFEVLADVIKDVFVELDEKNIDLNIKAARAGFDFFKINYGKEKFNFSLPKKYQEKNILLTGNDAISLGAIKAGLKFFACYPMTPINSILAYLAKYGPEKGIVYIQPEDEISGINMAIGAGFAGVRSMVATSGGGFSLMTEAYGLAGMTETPLVIIMGQRPGPATGLPTWGGQGDLRFVLHAAQDEFPRIILAPGDPEECFWLTIEAFNLAEVYQTPVVILTDKHLAESHWGVKIFNESLVKINRGLLMGEGKQAEGGKRYEITASGISPRLIPGQGLTFVANSDEHSEHGFSDEGAENRKAQMEKRMRKLKTLARKIPTPPVYGEKNSKLTLVGWGSSKGPIMEAQKILLESGIKTNYLHLNYLNPFPSDFVFKFLKSRRNILMVEQNIGGLGAGLIRERTGINIQNRFLQYDGRPLAPEEIAAKVKTIWRK